MFTILIAAALLATAQNPTGPAEWSYAGANGPAHWATLDPSYAACAGHAQSPIDIRSAQKASLPALRFDYKSAPLKYLINNTHAIRVNYHDAGSGDFLSAGDARYELYQFHFHLPSEEYVHGNGYAMDLHLMHRAVDGHEAGVAVQIKAGAANPEFQKILDHAPEAVNKEFEIPGVDIDPAKMLPADLAYYTYPGSLTGPPCTENVTWYVLQTPITVSPAQIENYARFYAHNIRPVQPLNGRIVQSSR